MFDARRRILAGVTGSADGAVSGLGARLRLFGLLASLVPLFGGLHYLADESAPRVEVRLVAPATASNEVTQAPVERVVERIVYVPVERSETTPLNATQTRIAATGRRRAETTNSTALGGLDTTNTVVAQAVTTEPVDAPVVAEATAEDEPADAPTEHMGLLAIATPAPAPVVRSAPVVARAVAPPPIAEPADDEEVAEAETPGDENAGDAVADAPGDTGDEPAEVAQIQVIDTTIEPDQSTRVVLYRVPVQTAPEATPANDSPAKVDDEAASAPPEDAPSVADTPDEAPTDGSDEAVAEPTDVDAKVVSPNAPAADDQVADKDESDETVAAPADADGDDADVADGDADAAAPREADDRPQLSVTVATTANGAFVSEDGSGQ